MRVLLIDAFDSFVYVIAKYYEMSGAETKVVRVNEDPVSQYKQWKPDLLVLGPGPGTPQEHSYSDIIREADEDQAIFGVCLGLQAIGEYFGWTLINAPTVQHGKQALVQHDGQGIYSNIPSPVKVVRYHSLAIADYNSGNQLITSATSEEDNVVMSIRHTTRPIEGVQFHPESIGTEHGITMIQNSLALTKIKSKTVESHDDDLYHLKRMVS